MDKINTGGLNSKAIFDAIDKLKSVGPIFTSMSMPKVEYDLLMAMVDNTNVTVDGVHNLSGIRISVNPLMPEQMIAAYDTEGNLWIIDLRAPNEMRNLGKSNSLQIPYKKPIQKW